MNYGCGLYQNKHVSLCLENMICRSGFFLAPLRIINRSMLGHVLPSSHGIDAISLIFWLIVQDYNWLEKIRNNNNMFSLLILNT